MSLLPHLCADPLEIQSCLIIFIIFNEHSAGLGGKQKEAKDVPQPPRTLRLTFYAVAFTHRLTLFCFSSGETAFKAMMESFGWARRPMLERIHLIRKDVPITMIYGANTWIDTSTGKKVKLQRPDSYVRDLVRCHQGRQTEVEILQHAARVDLTQCS